MECNATGYGTGSDTEMLVRSTLGPQHRPNDKIFKTVGRTARAMALRSTGNPRTYPPPSSPSSSARRSSPRSSTTYVNSSWPSSDYSRRKHHSRVTRANCKMTDAHGNQLSPTAPYLSCEFEPRRGYICLACDKELTQTFPSQTTTFAVCDNPGATLASERPRLTNNSYLRGYQGAT